MKIASWNVNSLKVRLPHLQQWLGEAQPDIIALQETKLTDDKFPVDEIAAMGYHAAFSGQKTYNGVAILARGELTDVVTDIEGLDDPQRRILAATVGDIRVVNLYVVNGKALGDEKYTYKLHWLAKVRDFLEQQILKYPKLVVLGDFNICRDDRDVYDPVAWGEDIFCSPPERAALQALFDVGLHDSFRMFNDEAGLFSWWDYRQAGFRRNMGLRIDLILISDALKSSVTSSIIDKAPRKWEQPSDHAPVALDDAELEVLDTYLRMHGGDGDLMLDGLHGLLSAIAIGPLEVKPEEWLHEILHDAFEDEDEGNRLLALLAKLNDSISAELDVDAYEPILGEIDTEDGPMLSAAGWCEGFSRGIDMRAQLWENRLAEDPNLMQLLGPIMALAVDEGVLQADAEFEKLTDEEYDECLGQLPEVLNAVGEYWRQNAPTEDELAAMTRPRVDGEEGPPRQRSGHWVH